MADSCKPNTKLFYSIYWGAQSDPNCYFHNAIQLKRSSASRSVNLQTNRTKTWQFKFTRNQGFTQDPNSEEMRRQWKAADNARTMRQTARRHRGRDQIPGKEPRRQGEPSGPAQYKHVFFRDKVLLALYKFCFQQLDKEKRFRYIQQNHP